MTSLGLKIEITVSKKQDYGSEMLTQPFEKEKKKLILDRIRKLKHILRRNISAVTRKIICGSKPKISCNICFPQNISNQSIALSKQVSKKKKIILHISREKNFFKN